MFDIEKVLVDICGDSVALKDDLRSLKSIKKIIKKYYEN